VFAEADLLPLSALQHLVFCERQCALIHIEQQWRDNPLTLEGSHMHGRVDDTAPRRERRGDLVILRGLPLRSLRLGLTGRADVVELHRRGGGVGTTARNQLADATGFDGLSDVWSPFPVDYKRGRPKADRCDEVQLCAQGLCLEEMLAVAVPGGALFYGRAQQRHAVVFDGELRRTTEETAHRLHDLISSTVTPHAEKMPRCKRCSLLEICMPGAMKRGRSASRYLSRISSGAGLGGGTS
jgi:CRISPR-associated exonuclease Cas4